MKKYNIYSMQYVFKKNWLPFLHMTVVISILQTVFFKSFLESSILVVLINTNCKFGVILIPTLNVNPTLFVNLCKFLGPPKFTMLQLLSFTKWVFIQISIMHANGFWPMNELIHHPWKLIHKKLPSEKLPYKNKIPYDTKYHIYCSFGLWNNFTI